MRAALQQIVQPRASHANVDDGVNLVAVVLVLPKRRVQRPDRLVAYSDRIWVHKDADGRQRSGIAVVGVLALQRREMCREAAGDFPRRIDWVVGAKGLQKTVENNWLAHVLICIGPCFRKDATGFMSCASARARGGLSVTQQAANTAD